MGHGFRIHRLKVERRILFRRNLKGDSSDWDLLRMHTFAHSLAPLTHLLAPLSLLRSRAHSSACSRACSLTPKLVLKRFSSMQWTRLFHTVSTHGAVVAKLLHRFFWIKKTIISSNHTDNLFLNRRIPFALVRKKPDTILKIYPLTRIRFLFHDLTSGSIYLYHFHVISCIGKTLSLLQSI